MYMMVTARYCETPLAAGQPSTVTYATISEAMRRALRPEWSSWVGPNPRVTRTRLESLEGCPFATNATWLLDANSATDEPGLRAVESDLRGRLTSHLRIAQGADGFWQIVFSTYNPVTDGTVEWWQSGAASSTRTMHSPDSGPAENPRGPNDLLVRQVTALDRVREGALAIAPFAIPVIFVGSAVVFAVVVLPRLLATRDALRGGYGLPPPGYPSTQYPGYPPAPPPAYQRPMRGQLRSRFRR